MFIFEIKKDYSDLLPKVLFKVWDNDMIGDDLIGEYELNIVPSIQNKNKWITNNIFELKNKNKLSG